MLFVNARALTFDPARPRARALRVHEGRIVAVGDDLARESGEPAFDCRGLTLVPAFVDAHMHLLATAAALRSVDCTPAKVRSIGEIQAAIWTRARSTPKGAWIRAYGYDESRLAERRHPTRRDLDLATRDHPVRLLHRSGHACVLNSRALELAGIRIDTEEPPGGVIDRELDTGEPSGLLIDMNEVVERVVPPFAFEELAGAVRELCARLVSEGVGAVVDATHTNGRDAWSLFEELEEAGALTLPVVVFEGAERLGELPERSPGGRLRRGAVKVMVREAGGLWPGPSRIGELVREAHVRGRQVAVHAIEEPAVRAAIDAIEGALAELPRADHRHRIEHAGVVPADLRARAARAGIAVVTQPAFLWHSGDRYLDTVAPEALRDLYPVGRLHRDGVRVAFSSDAPVVPPRPVEAVMAAVRRRSESGESIGPEDAVDVEMALRMHTADAAWASWLERERGSLRPGLRADFALLSGLAEGPDGALVVTDDLRVEATVLGGELAWVRPGGVVDTESGAFI
ncbi:MAG TPA: amidohydrolase [Dehalococcoidia bacterium]|nr:amidohydrolase [Dehalococcoidia bacterium]